MLEGLEAVELPLSVCKSIIDFRIDANTYKKEYLNTEWILSNKKTNTIEAISNSIQNFGAYSLCNLINFHEEGIPFLMTKNVRNNFIDWKIEKFVDVEGHKLLWKSHCKKGQVLVTMAGEYLGRAAVFNRDQEASSNQAIAKISLKSGQSPYTLSTFLNSKFGQHQIQRFKTITGQPNINMSLIGQLVVPNFSHDFCKNIEAIMLKADAINKEATSKYCFAETMLLETLDLIKLKPSTKSFNIKSFKDSFGITGRLDAEYYQPKYEQLMKKIAASKHGKLGKLVDIKKSIEPGSDVYAEDEEGLPFLRVADYSKQGVTTPQVRLNKYFVLENLDKIADLKPKRDTILFSKDGSVGEAYLLREDADFITSGAILHLTVKDKTNLLPDYLTLALNSIVVKQQAERDAGGSIILHWRKEEIENVLVPIIDKVIQQEIAIQVQDSFKLKAEAERLLAVAKRAVEVAIEVDEENALNYIREQNGV